MNDKKDKLLIRTIIEPQVPMWIFTHEGLCGPGPQEEHPYATVSHFMQFWEDTWKFKIDYSLGEINEGSQLLINTLVLPKGWQVTSEEEIVDDQRVHRASFMAGAIKGTIDLYIMPRYRVRSLVAGRGMMRVAAVDRVTGFETESTNVNVNLSEEEMNKAKADFMKKYYPEYLDPLAYW